MNTIPGTGHHDQRAPVRPAGQRELFFRKEAITVGTPLDSIARFNEVKDYMASLTRWAVVSQDDSSLVVDAGDLELQLRAYKANLDDLLAIPPIPENQDRISTRLAEVWASVGFIKMVCNDLEGPLDRLISALCTEDEQNEPGDEPDDNAG